MQADLCVISPFEVPDIRLALETLQSGGFPYLHLGRDVDRAREALATMARRTREPFGVALAEDLGPLDLPANVTRILVPWSDDTPELPAGVEVVWQVTSPDQAEHAIAAGAVAIALKGSDAGGRVGEDSAFVLFQRMRTQALTAGVRIYVHGGVGIHSAAAYLALGAAGVHLDSQVALLPECSAPRALKDSLGRLNGGETTLIGDLRVLKWPAMPSAADSAAAADLLGGLSLEENLIPLGQDFTLAAEYLSAYGHLDSLLFAIREATYGHLRQAQHQPALRPDSDLARELGTTYPVVQGPMARVSDTADFLRAVADGGALPMLAIGMATPASTATLVANAGEALGELPWGAGLLGFIPPATYDAQVQQILELDNKPAAVVIAGGRPAQGKRFEKAGIQAFLHVPSATLLDQYLKDGARRFIFEGRESGGHVGPLHSTVLWEKQIIRLLGVDEPSSVTAFFAGGIHDELSSAFVSLMTASLATLGVKVGVVIGTAYLTTDEAVSSGAITSTFRDLTLVADQTVLLESAPGQETRALPTAFADYFEAEKARVEELDMEPVARRIALEELNLGRARIASKGIDRSETGALVDLQEPEQVEHGLYMAGAAATLIDHPRTIAQLHRSVCEDAAGLIANLAPVASPNSVLTPEIVEDVEGTPQEPIAIIGMAGVFPEAGNVEEYWRNNLIARDSVTEVPSFRWDSEIFYREETTDTDFVVSKWGAFLSPTTFDPLEFGITPTSVSSVEPAQLLSLLVAKRALQDAGYADSIKAGLDGTSVIFGTEAMGELANAYGSRPGLRSWFGELPKEIDQVLPRVDEDSFAGILSNVTAGRIANRLNCGGRNFTVDAACASSLAALDVSCQELWSGRSDMVICGGADLHNGIVDYVMFSATYALSRKGRCATFDESGDGLTLGEGIGAVILKRLSDAERDGDRIYAVIRGVHGSSDGRSLGLTAPNMKGQIKALKRTYQMAGVLPSEVGLIEAHGTGTAVGDRTEMSALQRVMVDAGAVPGQTWVGSVKTQIGHTKCAAGLAGLIRAALAVRHGVIPPTLHLQNPVRTYREGVSPFAFNATDGATIWSEERRVAGLSGFGFGGTNFHAIVENYGDAPEPTEEAVSAAWADELFLVRGDTADEAREQLRSVRALYEANHDIALKDVAYTLATASDKPVQLSIVSGSWADLLAKIAAATEGVKAPGIHYRDAVDGKVAFLFSGQGSQRVNMARDLFVLFPWLRADLERHPEYLSILFPKTVFTPEGKQAQSDAVTDTRNAQPLLGFVDLALAGALHRFGVVPDAVAGHSYGELPALAYAGALPVDQLPGLSRARAESILGAVGDDPGAMAAIGLSGPETEELVAGTSDLWAVNYNSPRQTIVGGTSAAVAALVAQCSAKGVRAQALNVACAFHTPLLDGAEKSFAAALAEIDVAEPGLPVWSNTTAEPYPNDPAAIRARLVEHLVRPVRFADELRALYDDGTRVFVEAGPGAVLTGLVSDTLEGDTVAIRTEGPGGNGLRWLLQALGQYVATGRTIDVDALFEGRGATALDLASPESHATKVTAWMVDGLEAVPISRWREQGEQHLDRKSTDSVKDIMRSALEEDDMTQESPELATSGQPQTVPGQPAPVPGVPGQPAAPAPMQGQQVPGPVPSPQLPPTAMPAGPMQPAPMPFAQAPMVPAMPPMPSSQDHLVYAYLQNMRAMMDDQRDIMLTSLGYGQAGYGPAGYGQPGYGQPAYGQPAAPAAYAAYPPGYADASYPPGYPAAGYPMAGYQMPAVQAPGYPAGYPAVAQPEAGQPGYPAEPQQWAPGYDQPQPAAVAVQPEPNVPASTDLVAEPMAATAVAVAVDDEPIDAEVVDDEPEFVLPQIKDLDADQLKEIILEVVAEKTGYPTEMLGMDMDLEADLSIDSIKRLEIIGALGEKLDMPEPEPTSDEDTTALLEKMAAIKTLRGMVDWLLEIAEALRAEMDGEGGGLRSIADLPDIDEGAGTTPALTSAPEAIAAAEPTTVTAAEKSEPVEPVAVPVGAGATASSAPAAAAPVASAKPASATTAAVTANVAGTPRVAAGTALPGRPVAEKLSATTLAGRSTANAPTASSPTVEPSRRTSPAENPVSITRLVWDREVYPYSPESQPLTDCWFAVTDGPSAEAIRQELMQRGAQARVVAPGDDLSFADGLVVVTGVGSPWTIGEFFAAVKSMNLANAKHIAVFDDTLGTVKQSAGRSDLALLQGFPGFVKSLQHEFPAVRFKTVTGLSPFDTESLPRMVANELCDTAAYPEVSYDGTTRFRDVPAVTSAPAPAEAVAGLDGDSVVLVLGGAQGISPQLMAGIATKAPGHYVLVGRTARDRKLAEAYADVATVEDVQRRLISEGMNEPRQITSAVRSILKAKSIEDAIGRIEQAGATASYASVDLNDLDAFRGLVDEVRREHGRVDAVFHAAAVLEDKLFKDKTWESFERVYATKIEPLTVIAELLDELKLVVLFSSMSASFGNRGQCDYAAANSVFDMAASLWRTTSSTTVRSIAWGPWGGAGMVSPGLAAQMQKRGLDLIPLHEGGKFFVDELGTGKDSTLMAIAGEENAIRLFIADALSA